MGKIICISSQKGGVGKTTTAVNLSSALALAERNTLLLDLDFQKHATLAFGVSGRYFSKNIYDVLSGKCIIEESIGSSGIEYLKMIPSDSRLINFNFELTVKDKKGFILKDQLERIKEDFDYIIIDCPPAFNNLGITGIMAADQLLIPLQCEYFALESLGQFFNVFNGLKNRLKCGTGIGGILLNMHDAGETASEKIAASVKRGFSSMVYKTIIPRSRSIRESGLNNRPLILNNIASEGARSFISLAREIIGRTYS